MRSASLGDGRREADLSALHECAFGVLDDTEEVSALMVSFNEWRTEIRDLMRTVDDAANSQDDMST